MSMGLQKDQVAAFRRDGFLSPLRAISGEEAAAAVGAIENAEARTAHLDRSERDHKLFRFKAHLLFIWLDRIAHHPAILDKVENLIGPDILIWSSSLFIKEPGDPGYFGWHQDSYTYELEGEALVTAWVALSPATVASGAMRFLPGSHANGALTHRDTFDANSMGSRGEELANSIDDNGAVDIVLSPGEFSLHHVQMVHESRPNVSDARRIGYAVRYLSPSTRPLQGSASVSLARGEADPALWRFEPRPAADLDDAALAAYAQAAGERMTETFKGADDHERAQRVDIRND
ncbi:MAG: phytanoyl-CoA dioxygenase [Gammaproteobacteria bacterium]|nr:phytanoyl-CoA dioxygenase [Gammaproteobacteria bacterium]